MNTADIDALTRSLAGSFAFCGIAVADGDARHFSMGTAPGIDADAHTVFRVASVSKMVVGEAIAAFVKTKATWWGADIADILGWPLRHPLYRDVPVTLGMIASHSAGLSDAAGCPLICASRIGARTSLFLTPVQARHLPTPIWAI